MTRAVKNGQQRSLNFPECTISHYDPIKETVQVILGFYADDHQKNQYFEDVKEIYKLSDYPATAQVIKTGLPLIVHASDSNADPAELAYLKESGSTTLLILPLHVKGKTIVVVRRDKFAAIT